MSPESESITTGNLFLDQLPRNVIEAVMLSLKSVSLKRGETIFEPNKPFEKLYFRPVVLSRSS